MCYTRTIHLQVSGLDFWIVSFRIGPILQLSKRVVDGRERGERGGREMSAHCRPSFPTVKVFDKRGEVGVVASREEAVNGR